MEAEERKKEIEKKLRFKKALTPPAEEGAIIENQPIVEQPEIRFEQKSAENVIQDAKKLVREIQEEQNKCASIGEIAQYIREVNKLSKIRVKSDNQKFVIKDIDFDDETEIITIKVE